MARIHLLTVHPETKIRERGGYVSLLENSRIDRYKVHQLVDSPGDADLILFAEIDVGRLCEDVMRHPYIKRYRNKCFMFSTDWRVIPFLPGVYTGVEKSYFLPRRVRAGFYPSCLINPKVRFEPEAERDLLYSFMGDVQTHPVRRELARLPHPRGAWIDTSSESQDVMWKGSLERREMYWERYAGLLRRSKFVLCPRGISPASIRLFEAMCVGRVPVVLSDEWVAPEGPKWDSFCLFVPEREAASVPRMLEEREGDAAKLGLVARREWETYFSPEVAFHRVVELCLELQRGRTWPDWIERQAVLPQLLRWRNLQEYRRYFRGLLAQRST
jgi:hypothetical protein